MENMEWYVLRHEFNEDKIESFNIFHSVRFYDGVEEALKKFVTYDTFKEEIRIQLFCAFGSKVEYEIICSGLFEKSEEFKIDIYYQVLPNLDILCRYIIEQYNKRKRKKIIIEEN